MSMGMVFDIQRMSLHDGPGIRTSVFLKGCPLVCAWCHNPESQKREAELFYKPEKCIHCGRCTGTCEVHTLKNSVHEFRRERCSGCLSCTDVCPAGALERSGVNMTVGDVMDVILRDRAFYEVSGGGVTITGGEPLMQFDFALELAGACKDKGLHVCVDTSGCYSHKESVEQLISVVDLFLFDIKETDSARHCRYTGATNDVILSNLDYLDKSGCNIDLRCPVIPKYNDRIDHFDKIALLANSLQHVCRISVVPYHPLGRNKCEWLGRRYPVDNASFPDKSCIEEWIAVITSMTACPVNLM